MVHVQNTERNPGVLLSKLVSFPTPYTFQVGADTTIPLYISMSFAWLADKQCINHTTMFLQPQLAPSLSQSVP